MKRNCLKISKRYAKNANNVYCSIEMNEVKENWFNRFDPLKSCYPFFAKTFWERHSFLSRVNRSLKLNSFFNSPSKLGKVSINHSLERRFCLKSYVHVSYNKLAHLRKKKNIAYYFIKNKTNSLCMCRPWKNKSSLNHLAWKEILLAHIKEAFRS